MFKIEKNEITGFNVNNYLKVFPGTATQYLDWKVAQLWFYTVYPEGAIISEEPTPDPFKTPDTWVCTTKVYLTREDREKDLPAIKRSARRGPKTTEQDVEDTVDTYTLSIIASVSNALNALGFAPPVLTNEEKENLEKELMGIPNDQPETPAIPVAPVANPTPVVTAPVVNQEIPTVTENVTPPAGKKRGRPTKEEVEAREAAAKEAEAAKAQSLVETPVAPVEVIAPPPAPAPVIEVKEETASPLFASLDEARNVECTYRNLKGVKMGEIWDGRSSNTTYKSYLDWLKNSDRAKAKHPTEIAAMNYIEANS